MMDLLKNRSFIVTPVKNDPTPPPNVLCDCEEKKNTITLVNDALTGKVETAAWGAVKMYAAFKAINTISQIAIHIATRR